MSSIPAIAGFADLEVLGRGGFSVVYEATQVDLGRKVAVKVLNFDASADSARRRFERECRAVGALSGIPGIVAVHQSAYTTDGRMAIVMELMPGGSLAKRVSSTGPMSASACCQLGTEVARALAEAHQLGIAHRDIKPGNILLSAKGSAALADFGIALVAEMETSTGTESSLSPPYAAPERLQGRPVDEVKADLWAFGATLYFALSGRAPFGTAQEGGISGLSDRVLTQPVPPIQRNDVSPQLMGLLVTMMAKDPALRPANARDVEAAFASLLAAPPTPARPVSLLSSQPAQAAAGMSPPAEAAIVRPPSQAVPSPSVQATPLRWPSASEYLRAVQDHNARQAPLLRSSSLTMTPLGMPLAATGQSTVVIQMSRPEGPLAVRCFTREPVRAAPRYRALAQHLSAQPVAELVPAVWHDDAIVVGGTPLPVVTMPWVPGLPLNVAVDQTLATPERLVTLAETWRALVNRLRQAHVGHGDLQHGNVLVDEHLVIRLIDLDGVWVPAVADLPPAEFGHPNFQHPGRQHSPWGADIDVFSAAVIYLSLQALAADTTLWSHQMGENLILTADDFAAPGTAPIWSRLAASPSEAVRALAARLSQWCRAPAPPRWADWDEAGLSGSAAPAPAPALQRPAPAPVASYATTTPNRTAELAPADDAPWWSEGERPEQTKAIHRGSLPQTAVPQQPRTEVSKLSWLGRTSAISGVIVGAVAGAIGSLTQGIFFPPRPEYFVGTGVLAVIVTTLTAGLLAAWPHLTARAWSKGANELLLGAGGGAVIGALAMLPANAFFQANAPSVNHQVKVSLALAVLPWTLIAMAAGLAAGLPRSGRAAASGTVGGLIGGFAGGAVFFLAASPTTVNGGLMIDGSSPRTLLAICLTTALIGLAVGLADRLARLASLTAIEGRLRGRVVNVDRASMTIGSGRGCALVLSGDPQIQDRHATLTRTAAGWMLEVAAPVVVNGRPVSKSCHLSDGDIIQIGGSFFRFEPSGQAG